MEGWLRLSSFNQSWYDPPFRHLKVYRWVTGGDWFLLKGSHWRRGTVFYPFSYKDVVSAERWRTRRTP